ncbi:MAG: alpha-L-fucosidase [Verrucomicrobiales bacterium]|nr:alpha-L-fucosidase [Verrucomicrobiales bacterium]
MATPRLLTRPIFSVALALSLTTPAFSAIDGLRYGAFICWTTSTFSAKNNFSVEADWPSEEETTPIQFAPPDFTEEQLRQKTDAWARLAVNAGMTHILLLTKHMDGLCLWDTAYPANSEFKITSPARVKARPAILHLDLVKAVNQSCDKYGLKLGLYYCLRDRKNDWNMALVKQHLRELLTNYGPIEYLWLDTGYGGTQSELEKQELVDYVHGAPPGGLGHATTSVGFNVLWSVYDFMAGEFLQPRPNPPGKVHEFTFPLQSGLRFRGTGKGRFFYTAGEDGKCMSAEDLKDYYERASELLNVFDINVGPDRNGDLRAIDMERLQLAGRMIFVNDDSGPIYGGPGTWIRSQAREVGDFGDDGHFTTFKDAYCEYTFTGTGIDVITEKNADMGTMNVYVDGTLRHENLSLYHPPPKRLVRQTVFSISALEPGPHTIRLQNTSGAWIGLDAFRVHPRVETGPDVPTRLSVDSEGAVWVIDRQYRIWKSVLPNSNPISSWERIPGTARDIGCGGYGPNATVWKIGTEIVDRDQWPGNYSVTRLQFDYWKYWWAPPRADNPGAATRVDVASDGSAWMVNSTGSISGTDWYTWTGVDAGSSSAVGIACRPNGDSLSLVKIGADFLSGQEHSIAKWNGTGWDPLSRGGNEIDVALNGDVWVVTSSGAVWRYRASLSPNSWSYLGEGVRDIGCGADGSVWRAGMDDLVTRFPYDPNDLFQDAIELVGTQGAVRSDSGQAGKEIGEPWHAGNPGGKSLWWWYRPTSDGILSLDTQGSDFDTLLGSYEGAALTRLAQVAANDHKLPHVSYSGIEIAVKTSRTYRIAVDGRNGQSGAVQLNYAFRPASVFELRLSATDGGTVGAGSGVYASNKLVLASATAAAGFEFLQWEGTITSRKNPIAIQMTRDNALTAIFAPVDHSDGFETGDLGRLKWRSDGGAFWPVQTNLIASGSYAARSAVITHGQATSLFLEETCLAGTGFFDVRVESEPLFDALEFYVTANGETQRMERWSGQVEWTRYYFEVRPGANRFEWRYTKSPQNSAGRDAAFIDNVNLPLARNPAPAAPADLRMEASAGAIHLRINGQGSRAYVVESSPDLVRWQPHSTNWLLNGSALLAVPAGTPGTNHFYRATARYMDAQK